MRSNNNDSVWARAGLTLKRRGFLSLALSAAVACALAGPGAVLAKEAGGGGTLRVGANANPSSLDPATGGAGSDHVFLYPIFDTLIEWEYDSLKAKPGLAKSWKYTDPKTLVLTLQEGVKFHDGTAFDAEAVKINLDRNRSDKRSNIRTDLANVESVDVTGPLEVTLHLKEADSALPLILSDRAGMMMSPKAIKEFGDRTDRNPVGTGAMKFVSWADGAKLVLARNENYWKAGKPKLDGIEFHIIPDPATRLRAVMSGQADIAYQLEGHQLPIMQRMKSLQTFNDPTVYVYQLYVNSSRGALKDPRVRQALNYAIDRDAFVKATMGGAGEPAYMNLPKSHWAYSPEARLYDYNPDKAKQLLAEAGYPNGLTLDLRGYNDQASVQKQEFLLNQLAKVGVRGRFQNGTIAEASAAFFGTEKAGDLLLSAWTGRPDPSLTYALLFAEKSYFNSGRVAPPAGYMDAVVASRNSDDIDARKAALAKAQRLAMENALVIPLAFRNDIVAVSKKVQGYQSNLLGKPKFENVTLAK